MKVNGQLCVQQGISKESECCLETGPGIVHPLPVVIIRLYIIYRHTHTKNTFCKLWAKTAIPSLHLGANYRQG